MLQAAARATSSPPPLHHSFVTTCPLHAVQRILFPKGFTAHTRLRFTTAPRVKRTTTAGKQKP